MDDDHGVINILGYLKLPQTEEEPSGQTAYGVILEVSPVPRGELQPLDLGEGEHAEGCEAVGSIGGHLGELGEVGGSNIEGIEESSRRRRGHDFCAV